MGAQTRLFNNQLGCRHLRNVAKHELSQFRSRFNALRRVLPTHMPCEIRQGGTSLSKIPCMTCGYTRLKRGDDALVCLHCGHVGCWNPFLVNEVGLGAGKHGSLHFAVDPTHWLAVHVDRFQLYCGRCGDFIDSDCFQNSCTSPGLFPGSVHLCCSYLSSN